MNSKISLPELISALAASSGASRNVCERFLKSMFSIISATLAAGENVKVKGLGTFKVSDVEERKSVNVNTGAEIIIPGHKKVTFTPDKGLAEAINQPFSMFEAVELDEQVTDSMLAQADTPSEKAPEQPEPNAQAAPAAPADEKAEIPTETPAEAPAESAEELPALEQPADNDPWEEAVEEQFSEPAPQQPPTQEAESPLPATESPLPAAVETESEEQSSETESPAAPPVVPLPPIPPTTATPAESTAGSTEIKQSQKPAAEADSREEIVEVDNRNDEKVEIHLHSPECHAPRFRNGICLGIAIAVAGMLVLFAAWRLLFPGSFCTVTHTTLPSDIEELTETAVLAVPVDTTQVKEATDTLPEEQQIQPVADDDQTDPAPTAESDKDKTDAAKEEPVYDTITTRRFLTTMAKEHYGDYNLWPYIYDENASRLGHPDRIKPGTKVVIPPASKYGIDAKNPECVAKAKRRGAAIYAKYNK